MTRATFQRICLILAGCAIAIGLIEYLAGWATWTVAVWLVMVPTAALLAAQLAGTELLRRYRFLLYILTITLICGGFEAWQHRKIPRSILKSLDISVGPGEPDLFLDYDLPGLLTELYPQRSEALFMRGFQLKMCYEDRLELRPSGAVCSQFREVDLPAIRDFFEAALRQHSRTDENLYYHYVEVLIRMNALESEIDAAAKEWKRLFPQSRRRDPRLEFERFRTHPG